MYSINRDVCDVAILACIRLYLNNETDATPTFDIVFIVKYNKQVSLHQLFALLAF